MKIKPIALIVTVALASSVAMSFADDAEADASPAKTKASPEAAFNKLDTNKDGKVTLDEVKASKMGQKNPEKAEARFNKKDANKDGSLSLEEFSAGKAKK